MSGPAIGSALAMMVAILGVGACGGRQLGIGASLHRLGGPVVDRRVGYVKGDGDDDPYNPRDDYTVRAYGREAGVAERRAVAALTRRYFMAAAAGKGPAACRLLARQLGERSDLSPAVPADYSSPATAALAGEPCGRFMTGLFHANRQQLAAADPASVVLAGLRVRGLVGLAVLGFRTAPERQMAVRREHGAWKVDVLLDLPIP